MYRHMRTREQTDRVLLLGDYVAEFQKDNKPAFGLGCQMIFVLALISLASGNHQDLNINQGNRKFMQTANDIRWYGSNKVMKPLEFEFNLRFCSEK